MKGYRPEIDGLRALAVVPVILFHADLPWMRGGFIGVDVFFVISGYLITRIIVDETSEGRFSFASFYERRARRILPALLAVVIFCLPVALALMPPREFRDFASSATSVVVFASNFYFWSTSGYFDTASELKPLLHTWSLAVEEQFYLLYPLAIVFALRLKRSAAIAALIVVLVASFAYSLWASINTPAASFYLLPARVWELLLGATVFFAHAEIVKIGPRGMSIAAAIGAAAIVAAVFVINASSSRWLMLMPTVGAAAILASASGNNLVGKILRWWPLVSIGLISYSAYLWHQPLLAFARLLTNPELSPRVTAAVLATTFVLAAFTFRFIEQPFRQRALPLKTFLAGIAGVSLTILTISIPGHTTTIFENVYAALRYNGAERRVFDLVNKHTGGSIYDDMFGDGSCIFWSRQLTPDFRRRFDRCAGEHQKAHLVIGDSHALNIYNALGRTRAAPFVVSISEGGCRPARPDVPTCDYNGLTKFIDENKASIRSVIFHQSGSYLLAADERETNMKSVKATFDFLDRLSDLSVATIFLGPFVDARVNFRRIGNLSRNGFSIRPETLMTFFRLDHDLAAAAQNAKFSYISMNDAVKMSEGFVLQGDCLVYRDQDHLSVCGETLVGADIWKQIKSVLDKNS